ncbi:nucleoside deaminase [Deinococcus sonorensis]|uniref:Nucleoside deaminase n=1 Tax=Deinococcus sonorensis TaxID=309891 RepID=A0ABV8YAI0_9DEIO
MLNGHRVSSDEDGLRLAFRAAVHARQRGEDPFGAVIVQGQTVLASSGSRELELGDPTAHAEVLAIREACQTLRTLSLVECTLYASTEPCIMCSGALKWAGIERVVYSVPQSALQAASGGLQKPGCAQLVNTGRRHIEIVGPLLQAEGLAVLADHVFTPKALRYAARHGDAFFLDDPST